MIFVTLPTARAYMITFRYESGLESVLALETARGEHGVRASREVRTAEVGVGEPRAEQPGSPEASRIPPVSGGSDQDLPTRSA